MISAVLFDKDGTLFDFERSWSNWSYEFLRDQARNDAVLTERLGRAVGFDTRQRTFSEDSVLLAGTPNDIAACLLEHLPGASRASLVARMTALSATAPQAEAAPLGPLLDDLRQRGLRIGLATNDSETPARAHLASAGVLERFDLVLGSDSGFGAKPQPSMPRAFADLMGVDPACVVMVGDSRHDLQAARAAGMRAVAVLTGISKRRHLQPLAEAVLPSIAALPDWIDREVPARTAA